MTGTMCVVIGPNGYGKTGYLSETSKKLADAGKPILMILSRLNFSMR